MEYFALQLSVHSKYFRILQYLFKREFEHYKHSYVMQKNISETIDFLRFPMAVAVVYLHAVGSYTNWDHYTKDELCNFTLYDHISLSTNVIFQIAVPLFFYISGFLFMPTSSNNYIEKLKSRTKSVLYPYLYWNLIAFLLLLVIKILGVIVHGNDWENVVDFLSIQNISDSFIGDKEDVWHPINAPLWFIRDLYVMFLVYPIIRICIKGGWVSILILSVLYLFNLWHGLPFLRMETLFFFSIGVWVRYKDFNVSDLLFKYRHLILCVAIFAFLYRYINDYRELMPLFIVSAISLILIYFPLLQNKAYACRIRAMKKYSFFIFAFHMIILERLWAIFYHPILKGNEITTILSYIINPIIIVLMCIIAYKFLSIYNIKILNALTGDRDK